jgi:hypothetical protein
MQLSGQKLPLLHPLRFVNVATLVTLQLLRR